MSHLPTSQLLFSKENFYRLLLLLWVMFLLGLGIYADVANADCCKAETMIARSAD